MKIYFSVENNDKLFERRISRGFLMPFGSRTVKTGWIKKKKRERERTRVSLTSLKVPSFINKETDFIHFIITCFFFLVEVQK
jgi:hypothetical protein